MFISKDFQEISSEIRLLIPGNLLNLRAFSPQYLFKAYTYILQKNVVISMYLDH